MVIISTKFLAHSISTYMIKVETRNTEEDYEEWENHIFRRLLTILIVHVKVMLGCKQDSNYL